MKLKWLVTFTLLSACVQKINFDVPRVQSQIVVEGMISDAPGPYTVKLSNTIDLNAKTAIRNPVEKASIKLFDDVGNVEDFSEIGPGVYETGGAIQGQVGHAYHIVIVTAEGKVFQSASDTMYPVGNVQNISWEYQSKSLQVNSDTAVPANIFNVYVDADATSSDNYVRWKFSGTFRILTFPERRITWSEGFFFRDPPPCSGWIVLPKEDGGALSQVGPCTCCICWVNQYELTPTVSDGQYISENEFRHIKLAEVPINNFTFYDKYYVEVEQMSLSRNAYDFFRLIRAQTDGTTSLFQPPSGQVNGNMIPLNSNDTMLGLFYATSIKSKSTFIERDDVPYKVTLLDTLADACNYYWPTSVTTQPSYWK